MDEKNKLVLTTDTASIDAGKPTKIRASTGQKEFTLSVKTTDGVKTHEVKDGSVVVDITTTDKEVVLTASKTGWESAVTKIPVSHEEFIKIIFPKNNREVVAGIQLNEITPYEVPILLRKAANSIEQQMLSGQVQQNRQ